MGKNRGERNARVFRDGLRIETERGHAFLKIKVEFVRLLTGGLVGGHVNLHEGRRAPARAARMATILSQRQLGAMRMAFARRPICQGIVR